jgi:hypothetical protein
MTSLVQQSTFTSASSTISLGGVAQGNTLRVIGSYHNFGGGATLPTVADSLGQTWQVANTPASASDGGQPAGLVTYFLPNANAGTHTLTWAVDGLGGAVYVCAMLEFTGEGTSVSVDRTNSTTNNTGGVSTISSGTTGTLNAAVEVVLAGFAEFDNTGSTTANPTDPPAGFTSILVINNSVPQNQAVEFCYQITSATTALNPSWSWTQVAEVCAQALIVSFKTSSNTASIAWVT